MKRVPEKSFMMMCAHLDGIYKFSARSNCDELITEIIIAYIEAIRKDAEMRDILFRIIQFAHHFDAKQEIPLLQSLSADAEKLYQGVES